MNRLIIPSSEEQMTSEQIKTLTGLFEGALEKRRHELWKDSIQEIMGTERERLRLARDLFTVLCASAERSSNRISFIVTVNYDQTPEQAISATKRVQDVDLAVIASMPRGAKNVTRDMKVVLFRPSNSAYDEKGLISYENADKEYESRRLIPADLFVIAAMNQADPALADRYPNVTQWMGTNHRWGSIAFGRLNESGRRVQVKFHDAVGWHYGWWFVGIESPLIPA